MFCLHDINGCWHFPFMEWLAWSPGLSGLVIAIWISWERPKFLPAWNLLEEWGKVFPSGPIYASPVPQNFCTLEPSLQCYPLEWMKERRMLFHASIIPSLCSFQTVVPHLSEMYLREDAYSPAPRAVRQGPAQADSLLLLLSTQKSREEGYEDGADADVCYLWRVRTQPKAGRQRCPSAFFSLAVTEGLGMENHLFAFSASAVDCIAPSTSFCCVFVVLKRR